MRSDDALLDLDNLAGDGIASGNPHFSPFLRKPARRRLTIAPGLLSEFDEDGRFGKHI
jgi:hypothetical protein